MEPPVVDDTMEMASPYQGHADDFDIDLDVMDDQASNTDKDMIGADEYEAAPHKTEYEQDDPNDADMIDEVAEPAMLDVDDQYAETSYSVEMQYGTEKIYEAEMLEDDYVEDIDAPVPEARVPESQEAPASLEPADNQVTSEHILTKKNGSDEATSRNHTVEAHSANDIEPAHPKDDAPKEVFSEEAPTVHHHEDEDNIAQEAEVDQPESADVDNNVVDTNQPEQADIHETPGDNDDHTAGASSPEVHEDDADENQQTADKDKELEPEGRKTTEHDTEHDESYRQETEFAEDDEQEQDITKDSSLYPVRVYYQDNEISLFPPQEGDSSETFFLEDENLAYTPLGELFRSCRQVLQGNVGENEVLVMDVDALNIQLTEDSLHISKVTLYQIVDLYLQLCHNDGIDEPEPLYLTLTTKLTIPAEVSDLLLAASEGKGLSEIHSWDGYQEVEAASAEIFDGDDQEANSGEEQQVISDQQERHPSELQEVHENESDFNERQIAEAQPEEQYPENDGAGADLSGGTTEEIGVDDETEAPTQPGFENPELHDRQPLNEESYDSEEEQHTESTATITNFSATDLTEEQLNPDGSTDVPRDDHQAYDIHEEQYAPGSTNDGGYPEEDDIPINPNQNDGTEEVEGDASDHGHDHHAAESITEELREESSKELDEDNQSEVEGVASQYQDAEIEETLQGDKSDALPKLGNTGSDVSGNNVQPTPDLADDSSGIAEDIMNSPIRNSSATDNDIEGADLPEEFNDATEHVASNYTNQEIEELPFDDDEDYLDLGIAEDLGDAEELDTKSPGLASTKRHREPEDEFELAESPTPDAKRSKSS
ncbi:conserved glutamic acid-rich protein [Aspergillus bombycis]|uniref:Conserved glutamic acid-rich protein n=1 Tax=Aspergillus bombycis TaxID=109264 RepID=A0A1F8A5P2_9EURO|nr:conserved glutamic acid-rich protein [Aspergillus bombycis]OGM46719.1 conserved glutamic acid-rich protein [Aspergillus bombycis]